ncbi:aspartic proteinase 36-like isoform X2 [Rhodamnia argentea]|uniref:Aspartic proteinase 36-like isoform X2 n=1 Tax=Rhodamnia argentea TaxID=178133 RepID=A0A8B8N2M3_9MYRT|nr:aspartic proteinase 36-like isoform X2 [Rhodamnia argentea]
MAPSGYRLTALLLTWLSLTELIVSTQALSYPSNRHRPLILPLSLTPHDSSASSSSSPSHERDHHRRRLHNSELSRSASARMRLYDDLLSNGYYTTRLSIGTPPQEFALIVDTGSTVTYVPCSNCQQCGKHQDPRFQPHLSSTYQPVKCNAHCYCDTAGKQCTYQRRYAEMSSSTGVLGNDLVSFGNESELTPQRAVFGCETVETGDLFSQRADGIMGLGRGYLSLVNQLVEKHVIDDSFSLCYGGMGVGGGAMILGSIASPTGMVFSHSDPQRSPYYNIKLKEIHVAGKPLKLRSSVFDGRHGTVLDSGTTYAYLPAKAFLAFRDAIINNVRSLKKIQGPDPNYHDVCFGGAGWDIAKLSEVFPKVDMVFGNKQKLSLSPENYLFKHTKVPGAYCLGVFENKNDETTLLGGIIVRNTLVTYDREKNKLGFWKTNCSELWKQLEDTGCPTPAPLVPQNHNTTPAVSPSLAPSGLPPNSFPVEFRVGVIMFNMSFSIKNSSWKPNFTEFEELIAHELGMNTAQVHLLNFTSSGNQFLAEWAIFPADSADYISNTTAVNIITRLRDHHVQLPERFGSYQLVEWKIEPQKERTWWQRNYLAVAAVASVALFLTLTSIALWFVWKNNRQQSGSYKPVGVTIPEQELQPL